MSETTSKKAVCQGCKNWVQVFMENSKWKLVLHRKNIGDVKYCSGSGKEVRV